MGTITDQIFIDFFSLFGGENFVLQLLALFITGIISYALIEYISE